MPFIVSRSTACGWVGICYPGENSLGRSVNHLDVLFHAYRKPARRPTSFRSDRITSRCLSLCALQIRIGRLSNMHSESRVEALPHCRVCGRASAPRCFTRLSSLAIAYAPLSPGSYWSAYSDVTSRLVQGVEVSGVILLSSRTVDNIFETNLSISNFV